MSHCTVNYLFKAESTMMRLLISHPLLQLCMDRFGQLDPGRAPLRRIKSRKLGWYRIPLQRQLKQSGCVYTTVQETSKNAVQEDRDSAGVTRMAVE